MTQTTDPFGPKKKYRSVSQLNQYTRCPHSYYLARIAMAWQRPAAWLAQGSAVHAVLEARERSGREMSLEEAQELFKEEYAKEANEALAITPNTDWWSASGPYRGDEDLERRFHIGLEQIEKYFAWTDAHPEEEIWTAPDGTPAIELEFDIDLEGIPVRGFIDAIIDGRDA